MKKKCYIFGPLLAACISELAFSFTSLLIKQQHLQLILLYRPGQRQLENKFNDLIFKQLLAIILQTNLQSHQLFSTDRQNSKVKFKCEQSTAVLAWLEFINEIIFVKHLLTYMSTLSGSGVSNVVVFPVLYWSIGVHRKKIQIEEFCLCFLSARLSVTILKVSEIKHY